MIVTVLLRNCHIFEELLNSKSHDLISYFENVNIM